MKSDYLGYSTDEHTVFTPCLKGENGERSCSLPKQWYSLWVSKGEILLLPLSVSSSFLIFK